jgi:SAM-dependent methyltransferase
MKPYADHFSSVASAYAACRPRYPAELFTYLSSLPARQEIAWDCAAGSGLATLPLTRSFRRVLATDVSAEMLERAPRHPRIEYRVSRAEDSGLADASADLVTVAQALHWLDIDPFYAEVERVLAPGGVLAVWSYTNQLLGDRALDAVLTHFYTDVVGPYWPAERRHVEAGYRTLPFPYAELPVPGFAMEERWTLPQLLGYLGTWSATQRFREARGYDPVAQLGTELSTSWGDSAFPRPVRWPLSLRVGRKPSSSSPKEN